MAETFTQVPPDSTGDKLRMRDRVVGADTVLEQAVVWGEYDTWSAVVDASAFAGSKHHITIFNGVGSGSVVQIHELMPINLSIAAVTGVGVRFEVRRATASSAGTLITAESWDTGQAALNANIAVRTGATVTNGNLILPFGYNNDEILLTGNSVDFAGQNILPPINKTKPFTLREGQGLTVQQITATTVGSFAWFCKFSVLPTYTA